MENIIKVALMLLADRRPGEASGATRITTGALCSGFAFMTMAAGIACGLAALWMFLEPRIGHVGAALTVASILLVLSGILLLVARSMFTPDEDIPAGPAIGEELMDELRAGFEENKGLALMAALVAGLVFGGRKKTDA
jgi:hypothetical protein